MEKRPVTLCSCQWADIPFDELCVLAKKMGYDGLEIACWGNGIDIDKAYADDAYAQYLLDTLKKHDLIQRPSPRTSLGNVSATRRMCA